jgi:hypothetical protein
VLAVNIAIQILLEELPVSTVKKHAMIIVNTLYLIVNTTAPSVIKNIEKELTPTFDSFLRATGCYDVKRTEEDTKLFNAIVDKLLKNLLSV